MPRTVLVPDAVHPITIEPTGRRVVVRVGAHVVADTCAALTLREASYPPVHYLPLADVDASVLRPSDTSSYCPYKGEANYHTVETPDGVRLDDLIWGYEQPYPAVAAIAGHVAFYPDRVTITVTDPAS
ncbi:conserved hypothetical protein [Frankia canadensis]|uniref:DUF427 domain-containing protein n=1 Tax=Frankia canadensis TaxID=1836972 RepID=A0A2I2L1K8_9ACTN|nr:DUF427 domain-containing protein [Frankia canadensis]SNQ51804.1 conserved hypothetical protein [Frankia canadensis]SOU59094.1 conserved hypothetical protein [Frankia canadensis]